jgi:hypothetical protein
MRQLHQGPKDDSRGAVVRLVFTGGGHRKLTTVTKVLMFKLMENTEVVSFQL